LPDTIAGFATDTYLKRLAQPANFRLGQEIVRGRGVVVTSANPHRVTALVTPPGGQRRTVELSADAAGLHCRCSCTGKAGYFCKHCVAVALKARQG
jgi:uncharacterized Zn finger protein